MRVKQSIRGIDAIQSFLKSVPRGATKTAIQALADWYVGKDDRGLRHYEPYKYVTPFRSYSTDPVKAAKQRRWIFAHLDEIGRDNRRTEGGTKDFWKFNETKGGYAGNFENKAPGAGWLWGDRQTRQNQAVGHRRIDDKIASNYLGAIRHAAAAVKKFLQKRK